MPLDFYEMEIDEYLLLKSGYLRKRVQELRIVRQQTAITISPWLKNAPDMMSVWPLPMDEEIRKKRSEVSDNGLAVLNKLKSGVTYKMVDGKIIEIDERHTDTDRG